ncbi:MAG: metal ABC transporter solute-binding protein, Zn/Mn family [Candidatus Saccharicenans sp.]
MRKKYLLAIGLILILITAFSFGHQAGRQPEAKKIKIVTTIFPLTEMAMGVAGERAEVYQLIPTSIEVHNFQLKPKDLKVLSEAQILISVGGQLEPWLDKIEKSLKMEKTRKIRFFNYLENAHYPHLIPPDPHLWLDLKADSLLVDKIREELNSVDPEGIEYYDHNGEALKKELLNLDEDFIKSLGSCQQKILVVAGHQAFGYLASRYGLEQVSLTGQNPEAQPSPRKLEEIISLIKLRKIQTIFYESSTPPAYAETIARETGVKLRSLSTGVHLSRTEIEKKVSFIELMKKNLAILKESLSCQ